MKSGLDGRNNLKFVGPSLPTRTCLNEVRPRWPEQFYHSYVETYGPLSQ